MKYYIEQLRDLRERGVSLPERFSASSPVETLSSTVFTGSDANYYDSMFVVVIELCGEVRLLNQLFPLKSQAEEFARVLLSEDLGWKKGEE